MARTRKGTEFKSRMLRLTFRMPRRIRRAVAGAPPRNDRNTPLDFDTHWMLWLERMTSPQQMAHGSVTDARASMIEGIRMVEPPPAPLSATSELVLAGRPARLYVPAQASPETLLYLHGGGWSAGDLRTHDRLCRRLAAGTRWRVVSLDYRLAPEHPFPAGLDDTVAAFEALHEQIASLGGAPERIAIGGDSAGGNLAGSACLRLRDRDGVLPWLQVLIYPATDLRLLTESISLFAEGFLLTRANIDWYRGHYAAPEEHGNASILLAEDHSGLPPTILVTAGFDPLRDEGESYVAALRDAGNHVVHLDARDMVHGFANMDGALDGARQEVDRLIDAMCAHTAATRT